MLALKGSVQTQRDPPLPRRLSVKKGETGAGREVNLTQVSRSVDPTAGSGTSPGHLLSVPSRKTHSPLLPLTRMGSHAPGVGRPEDGRRLLPSGLPHLPSPAHHDSSPSPASWVQRWERFSCC